MATVREKLGLQGVEFFEQALFILLCIVFAGFFALDTGTHRILFYILLVSGVTSLSKNQGIHHPPQAKLLISMMIALFFYSFISVFWNDSLDAQNVLDAFKIPVFISVFIASFTLIFSRHKQLLANFETVFVYAAVFACCIFAALYFQDKTFDPSHIGGEIRLKGEGRLSNQNVFGKILIAALLVGVFGQRGIVNTPTFKAFIIRLLPLAILAVGLLLTGARGATLAFLVGIIITAIISKDKKLISLCAVSLIVGSILILTFTNAFDNWTLRADTHRFIVWSAGVDMIREHPIIGHGANTEYKIKVPQGNVFMTSVHNIYLGEWVYGGIVKFVMFIAFTLLLVYHAFKASKLSRNYAPLSLVICGVILFQFSGHTAFVNLNPEWFFIWLPAAYILTFYIWHNEREKIS